MPVASSKKKVCACKKCACSVRPQTMYATCFQCEAGRHEGEPGRRDATSRKRKAEQAEADRKAEKNRANVAAFRERCEADGFCRCGRARPTDGKKTCEKCLEENYWQQKRRRIRRKKERIAAVEAEQAKGT